jgi:hypothetical protein
LCQFKKEWNSMYYVFFWNFLQRMKFSCQRFGTLCLFHLQGVDVFFCLLITVSLLSACWKRFPKFT